GGIDAHAPEVDHEIVAARVTPIGIEQSLEAARARLINFVNVRAGCGFAEVLPLAYLLNAYGEWRREQDLDHMLQMRQELMAKVAVVNNPGRVFGNLAKGCLKRE